MQDEASAAGAVKPWILVAPPGSGRRAAIGGWGRSLLQLSATRAGLVMDGTRIVTFMSSPPAPGNCSPESPLYRDHSGEIGWPRARHKIGLSHSKPPFPHIGQLHLSPILPTSFSATAVYNRSHLGESPTVAVVDRNSSSRPPIRLWKAQGQVTTLLPAPRVSPSNHHHHLRSVRCLAHPASFRLPITRVFIAWLPKSPRFVCSTLAWPRLREASSPRSSILLHVRCHPSDCTCEHCTFGSLFRLFTTLNNTVIKSMYCF